MALQGAAAVSAQELLKQMNRIYQDYLVFLSQGSLVQSILNNHDNCYIVRGVGLDDKQVILDKLTKLSRSAPIEKQQFSFDENRNKSWLILEKIIERIAENGAKLLCEQNKFSEELTLIKKYIDLIKLHTSEQEHLLKQLGKIPESTVSESDDLERIESKLVNASSLSTFVETVVNQEQENKKSLESELQFLNTNEPLRHHHHSLVPFTFEKRTKTVIAT